MDSRIAAVMSFVRAGSRVADIGADHGHLSIALAENHLATRIIATEKNPYPFAALSKNISDAGLSDAIETRLGDGLKILRAGEVDTICIAGMGGALIANILDAAPEVVQSARQLIIQPMNGTKKIREWFAENSWLIEDEDLAEASGIIYEILSAVQTHDAVRTVDAPPKIFKRETSPLREKFAAQRIEKLQRVLNEMSKSSAARTSEKFATLQAEVNALAEEIHSRHSNSSSPI